MPILGDGGPIYTGPDLNPNPDALSCGDLQTTVARDFVVLLVNVGDKNLSLTAVTSSNAQMTFPSLVVPQTIAPNTSYSLTVRVTPTGVGAGSANITTESNAINDPVVIPVSWVGVAAGTIAVTADPTDWLFDNQKVGTSSAEKLFTVRNTGSVNVTVSAPTFPADFVAGPTVPAYPVVLTSGSTLSFGVVFAPIAEGFVTQNVAVNSTAASTPFNINVTGQAYLIDSAFEILLGQTGFLVALGNEGTVVVRQLDWADLNCEVIATIQKLHNFGRLAEDKTLIYFWFHYEDLGVVGVDITLSNQITGASVTTTRSIGTGAANAAVRLDIFEVVVEGENILVKFERTAGNGKLSILDYGFKFLPSEEVLGTFANSKTITPAFTLAGTTEVLLMSFQNLVRKLDSADFAVETTAFVSNSILLPIPTEEGAIPGFCYEKSVARVQFHYEDLGVATVQITVTSMRGQTSSQNVVIGTAGAPGTIELGIADLMVKDEVISVKFTHVSGPLSLLDYTVRYVMGGERAKV